MDDLLIVGTGAMARDVYNFVKKHNLYNIIGLACSDDFVEESKKKWKLPVCSISELSLFYDKSKVKVFVAISQFQNMNKIRRLCFEKLEVDGWMFATLISPSAIIYGNISYGCWIMDFAYVGMETFIGKNVIVGANAHLAHYCLIDDHVMIADCATVLGSVKIGKQSFIGGRATIFNDIYVGEKCLIGGGVVLKKSMNNYQRAKIKENYIIDTFDNNSIELKLLPPNYIKKKEN